VDSVFADSAKVAVIQNALDVTFTGSRSGLAAIELFVLIDKAFQVVNGETNLYKVWKDCVVLAEWFFQQLMNIVNNEKLIIFNKGQLAITIPKPEVNADLLSQKYSLMPAGDGFGIYVFPRITRETLNLFLAEYRISLISNL
jgi:hypothetical protein